MTPIERFRRSQGGFTLVEVMASLVVFTILLLGVTPLVASSLRGAALNREYTVAKNITTEAMERVRGLPFYDAASNRDVLDLYFPNLGTGYSSATKSFTTTCTPGGASPTPSGPLACPPKNSDGTARIPTGFTVTFKTEFVEVVLGSNPETYAVVTPIAGWTSNAEPPARLLRLSVTTSWLQGGQPKSYELSSYIGDRRLSDQKIRGEASVDFVVQALTSYQQDTASPISALRAIAGRSRSRIELKNFATAEQETSAAKVTLTRQEFGTEPGFIVSDQQGAQSVLIAPPDTTPAPRVDGLAFTTTSDGLSPAQSIAGATTTSVNETSPAPGVSVPNQLPSAAGNFSFTAGNGPDHFWVNNQKESGGLGSLLQFDDNTKIFSIHRVADKRLKGNSSAIATAIAPTSTRKVETIAHAEAARMVLLPTSFASQGVVVIDDFSADVGCKSTGNVTTSTVSGQWTATLRYWIASGGALGGGQYSSPITLTGSLGSTAADPLLSINRTNNPLVYDALLSSGDIYLFDDPAAGRKGYLDSWSSKPEIFNSKTATKSTVNIEYALQIVTAQTNPANEQTKLALTIGKLSCNAEDLR